MRRPENGAAHRCGNRVVGRYAPCAASSMPGTAGSSRSPRSVGIAPEIPANATRSGVSFGANAGTR